MRTPAQRGAVNPADAAGRAAAQVTLHASPGTPKPQMSPTPRKPELTPVDTGALDEKMNEVLAGVDSPARAPAPSEAEDWLGGQLRELELAGDAEEEEGETLEGLRLELEDEELTPTPRSDSDTTPRDSDSDDSELDSSSDSEPPSPGVPSPRTLAQAGIPDILAPPVGLALKDMDRHQLAELLHGLELHCSGEDLPVEVLARVQAVGDALGLQVTPPAQRCRHNAYTSSAPLLC
jgi:hypothetical protein